MIPYSELCSLRLSTVFQNAQGYHVMQYTGLKNKNGKEIYEGDILGRYTPTGKLKDWWIVVWTEEPAAFYADEQPGWDGTVHGFDIPENWEKLDVIGNIYENPELLKTI